MKFRIILDPNPHTIPQFIFKVLFQVVSLAIFKVMISPT